jgi:uncharacterized protein YfeS
VPRGAGKFRRRISDVLPTEIKNGFLILDLPAGVLQRFGIFAMATYTEIWDVTPETAHPRALELISEDSLIWDFADEDSPLGNDIGADTFAAYLTFRQEQPNGKISTFIANLFDVFELEDTGWDLLDPDAVQEALDEDEGFSVLTRDDFILGLAFGQLVTEGEVDEQVKSRALQALKRQALDDVLEFRNPDGDTLAERREQLEEFQVILSRA